MSKLGKHHILTSFTHFYYSTQLHILKSLTFQLDHITFMSGSRERDAEWGHDVHNFRICRVGVAAMALSPASSQPLEAGKPAPPSNCQVQKVNVSASHFSHVQSQTGLPSVL